MKVHLDWEDPATGELQSWDIRLPVALGRDLEQALDEKQKRVFSKITLDSQQVSRLHAVLRFASNQLLLEDRSANGTVVNGKKLVRGISALNNMDAVQIGPYTINVTFTVETASDKTEVILSNGTDTLLETEDHDELETTSDDTNLTRLLFDQKTEVLYAGYPEKARALDLPEPFHRQQVSLDELRAGTRFSHYEEIPFVSIGGGIGSFVFVDTLRIAGIDSENIRVIGRGDPQPYGRYRLICRNSQIPDHERLRSGSDSCPDNIWGFPTYAWREAWREFYHKGRGHLALKNLWQVFAEPAFADTYTPKSGDVFAAMEREAQRIGWYGLWRGGHVRAIRKTTDDRYVVAYLDPSTSSKDYKYLVAQHLHLSTGYTSVRFLDDLQDYRHKTGDTKSIVNAYEPHDHVYEHLQKHGGTIILRGEGIVASRVIQRLNEARKFNPAVRVIHLVRSEKTGPHRYKMAKRYRENGWEFQPYNWPKGTWGGDMRSLLESAPPQERAQLLRDWGGTTTANRQDWRNIIQTGQKELWLERKVGTVQSVNANEQGHLSLSIQRRNYDGQEILNANYIIDATGLIAKPKEDPLLGDLLDVYGLPLNPIDGLHVANDFELERMRNGKGRMYVVGVMTLGGPYAPVDTFLGLQYAAQRVVENLARHGARGVRYIEGTRSFTQWVKWVTNQAP
jgi:pSer/pThr/pTyr-binding forkhead associated (FHA) protein